MFDINSYKCFGCLWIRIKILLRIVEQLGTVLEINGYDGIDELSWIKLETSAGELTSFLSNEFPPLMLDVKRSDLKTDLMQFDNLISLLVDVSLIREYHIVENYNAFMDEFTDTLKYFEKSIYGTLISSYKS